jgi:hypothetical protein
VTVTGVGVGVGVGDGEGIVGVGRGAFVGAVVGVGASPVVGAMDAGIDGTVVGPPTGEGAPAATAGWVAAG